MAHLTGDKPHPPGGSDALATLLGERQSNLRQVILRAHRAMNVDIARRFAARGSESIRPHHLTVLSNMNLDETTISELCERAQGTEDGIRRIARELEELRFIAGEGPEGCDRRLRFTDEGWELMLTSFNIQREIEHDMRQRLQPGDLDHLRRILGLMAAAA